MADGMTYNARVYRTEVYKGSEVTTYVTGMTVRAINPASHATTAATSQLWAGVHARGTGHRCTRRR